MLSILAVGPFPLKVKGFRKKLTLIASSCFAITSALSFMSIASLRESKVEYSEPVQLTAPGSWPELLPSPRCLPRLQPRHPHRPSSSSSPSRRIRLRRPPSPPGSAHPSRRWTLGNGRFVQGTLTFDLLFFLLASISSALVAAFSSCPKDPRIRERKKPRMLSTIPPSTQTTQKTRESRWRTSSGWDIILILVIDLARLAGDTASAARAACSFSGAIRPFGSSSFGIVGPDFLTICKERGDDLTFG